MSIAFEILGAPGRDNALMVRVDGGQSLDRLLFDCGDGCLSRLDFAEIQAIDALFFSHFHMDHVGGFDTFFRCNFNRETRPNRIFGPPGAGAILHHRFQGFLWNLHQGLRATWQVCDIQPNRLECRRYELAEAFAIAHDAGSQPHGGIILEREGYTVEALTMEHKTPSMAYVVREKPRRNIDVSRLASLGLRPGPWLRKLKEEAGDPEFIEVHGVRHAFAALRQALIAETPGDSIAYLTDFLLDEAALSRLESALRGCKVVICESQYRHADRELALRNYHMTCTLAAELSRRADVGELVLFHLSDRYTPDAWIEMLEEARSVFPRTRFPEAWK